MQFEVGGEIFLRLLMMVVVPVVAFSVMSGIRGLGDVRKLGRPGAAAITYFLCTTVLAVVVGLLVVNVIKPGVGTIDQATLDKYAAKGADIADKTEGDDNIGRNLLRMLFTNNLFKSAMEMQLLPIIVFAIVFAALLTTMGKRIDVLKNNIIAR